MKNKIFYTIVSFVLLLSCENIQQSSEINYVILGFGEEGCNKDIFTDIDIVPLEYSENSALSAIKQIAVVDSTIIIRDGQSGVLCFNMEGKYLHRLSHKGRAKNEYIRLNTFVVNNQNEVLLFDSFSNKIIYYNINGSYIKTERLPQGILSETNMCAITENGDILQNSNIINDKSDIYSLICTDQNSYSKDIIHTSPLRTKDVSMPIGEFPISKTTEGIKLLLPMSNVVYEFTGNNKITPSFAIATEARIANEGVLSQQNDFSIFSILDLKERGYFSGFSSIFENDKYMLLKSYGKDYFLIHKNMKKGVMLSSEYDEAIANIPLYGVKCATDFGFIGVISIDEISELKESINKDNQLLNVINTINTSSIEDNPVLCIYKLDDKAIERVIKM